MAKTRVLSTKQPHDSEGAGTTSAGTGSGMSGRSAGSMLNRQGAMGNQAVQGMMNEGGADPAGSSTTMPEELRWALDTITSQCVEAQCDLDTMLASAGEAQASVGALSHTQFLAHVRAAQAAADRVEGTLASCDGQLGALMATYAEFAQDAAVAGANNAVYTLQSNMDASGEMLCQSLTLPGGVGQPFIGGSLSSHIQACASTVGPALSRAQEVFVRGASMGEDPQVAQQIQTLIASASDDAEKQLLQRAASHSGAGNLTQISNDASAMHV